ncbi:hypothetical protein LR48_Vigan10g172400 [Vigna angularis]|uniref:DUF8039 domain-containing protein n=1 Tax=Phaseolus angularis TaxID=3914 RepID=A0A0L9VLP4_PHAAN|nr:hypothetical protein LR48_Vigan10g172400 [Vigna angularis]
MRQFMQQFESYWMHPQSSPVQEHVVPPIDGIGTMLVAHGTMFQAATIIHGMELSEHEVKVSVDDIIIPNASIPWSTNEIFTVAQTFESFIAWLKHLVGSVSNPPI